MAPRSGENVVLADIETFAKEMDQSRSAKRQRDAAVVFADIAKNRPEKRVKIARGPRVLPNLVNMLNSSNLDVQEQAARTLGNVAEDNETAAKTIGGVPEALTRLVGLLESPSEAVQEQAARALGNLTPFNIAGVGGAFVAVPGALYQLASLLEGPNEVVQIAAANILADLAEDYGPVRRAIVIFPAVLRKILDLRNGGSDGWLQNIAARVFDKLEEDEDPEVKAALDRLMNPPPSQPAGAPEVVASQREAGDVLVASNARFDPAQPHVAVDGAQREQPSDAHQSPSDVSQRYLYEEILLTTDGFAEEYLLGEGGFGEVYKGVLNGTEVAIRKIHVAGLQDKDCLRRQVEAYGKIRHPNVATLLGTCNEFEFCLVYDLMPNGNLENRLAPQGGNEPLTYQARVQIAAEVADALLHLHSTNPAPIIHGNVKPANILLGQNLSSKLGDVGLATIFPHLAPGLNPKPTGSLAYLDPELWRTGHLSPASDVYSFGVVLLQLLTARPPFGLPGAVDSAVSSGGLEDVLDRSAGVWPAPIAAALARLALKCTETGRAARPSLSGEIVPVLARLRSEMADAEERAAALARRAAADATIPHRFICPISHEIMKEPVVAADGNHYDRSSISRWLRNNNTSPLTNLELENDILHSDLSCLNEIREWQVQHPNESA